MTDIAFYAWQNTFNKQKFVKEEQQGFDFKL